MEKYALLAMQTHTKSSTVKSFFTFGRYHLFRTFPGIGFRPYSSPNSPTPIRFTNGYSDVLNIELCFRISLPMRGPTADFNTVAAITVAIEQNDILYFV